MTSFERTTCACSECVACCKRQPGPLAPGDLERIAERLGETPEEASRYFWASPGALVWDSANGRAVRIGTITPRLEGGRCVFLDEQDRCKVHDVAPFGCAMFDTHMGPKEAARRGRVLIVLQCEPSYQRLRRGLAPATSYAPRSY